MWKLWVCVRWMMKARTFMEHNSRSIKLSFIDRSKWFLDSAVQSSLSIPVLTHGLLSQAYNSLMIGRKKKRMWPRPCRHHLGSEQRIGTPWWSSWNFFYHRIWDIETKLNAVPKSNNYFLNYLGKNFNLCLIKACGLIWCFGWRGEITESRCVCSGCCLTQAAPGLSVETVSSLLLSTDCWWLIGQWVVSAGQGNHTAQQHWGSTSDTSISPQAA